MRAKMPKGKLLRSDQHPVARKIRKAIGATDIETVRVHTPQFKRTKNMPPVQPPPALPTEWNKLYVMTRAELVALGCGNWNGKLMLFPQEWYNYIPEGFEVTVINGKREKFQRGKTDDDIRFGCLAYGVICK